MSTESMEHWMEHCLLLAANADSATSPNPRVGCVILSPEEKLLGEGWHRKIGEPHAETEAIKQVRKRHGANALQGATLIVNLEPCNHQGHTPPCTHDILKAGISVVVTGMKDPNPAATGGIKRLRDANVTVITDVLKSKCYRFNEAFAHWQTRQIPFVTLKLAQTLDGCIATTEGESKWITGKPARTQVHIWRRESDAVLTGSGTARIDNPKMTVRHVSGTQPWRVILDGQGRLPDTLEVFMDEWAYMTIVATAEECTPKYSRQLCRRGGLVIHIPSESSHVSLSALIHTLGEDFQIQSLLVEAGPRLASALLKQNLADRLRLFVAPKLIGNGLRTFGDLGVTSLAESMGFEEHAWENIGEDLLFTGYKHPVPA